MYTNIFIFFFFNDTATTEIYTLSLHDALPISARSAEISRRLQRHRRRRTRRPSDAADLRADVALDRKSTRLNSSHLVISYAVFCLKKKKIISYNSDNYQYFASHTHPHFIRCV